MNLKFNIKNYNLQDYQAGPLNYDKHCKLETYILKCKDDKT